MPLTRDRRATSQPKKNSLHAAGTVLILLLGALIYSNSFQCSFHFDSLLHIVYNNAIRNLSDVGTWWNYLPNRPVSIFTFALDYHFFGLDVRYWHLVNLVIHLLNGLLVRWLVLLILRSPAMATRLPVARREPIALMAALMFITHPLATQSVTYIVQRMTSLAALFYLLSLSLYLKARLAEKRRARVYLLFTGSLIAAVLAVLSKENAYTLPIAILLVEIFFLHENGISANRIKKWLWFAIPVLVITLGIILWRFPMSIFHPVLPRSGHVGTITPLNYLFTQFSVIVKYIQLLFLPVNLHLEYDFPVADGFFHPATLLSFLFLLALVVLAVLLYRKHRVYSFGIAWFFVTLSIESGIIPIQDVIVEHRTYLPSFGFFLILGTGLCEWLYDRNRIALAAASLLLIGLWSVMTYQRNKVWKDDLTLLNDNIAKAPSFARPYSNRGVALWKRKEYSQAIADFSTAVRINPGYRDAWYNRGVVFEETGNYERALGDYTRAIAIDSTHIKAWYNRGVVHYHLGKYEEAAGDYTRAIAIDSGYADAWNNRGVIFVTRKEYDKALADFSKAIALRPDYTDAFSNRGATWSDKGDYPQAIDDYTRAIGLRPGYKEAFVNRAIAYGNLGQWDKAVADYDRALEIDSGYTQASAYREVALQKLKGLKPGRTGSGR